MKKALLFITTLLVLPTIVSATSINTSFNEETCRLTVSGNQSGHEATVSLFDKDNNIIGFKTDEINESNYSVDFVLGYKEDKTISVRVSDENGSNELTKEDVSIPACEAEKEYTLAEGDDFSITFTDQKNRTFTLMYMDMIGLTPEQLEAFEITEEGYNMLMGIIKDTVKKYGDLIAFYNIIIEDEGHNNYTVGPFNVKIKLTDEMKKYKNIYLINTDVNSNTGEVKLEGKPIKLTVNGDYLEGTLDHLSTYSLVGNNDVDETNKTIPKTGDNIFIYVGLLVIFTAAFIVMRKTRKH